MIRKIVEIAKSLPNKYKFILFGLFILGTLPRVLNIYHVGYHFDMVETQYTWAKNAVDMGFIDFWRDYKGFFDYLPGSLYLLSTFEILVRIFTDSSPENFVFVLKLFNWIVEIILSYLVYKFARKYGKYSIKSSLLASAIVYILPSLWFVSGVWGQMDSLIVVLSIFSLKYLYEAFEGNAKDTRFIKKYSLLSGLFLSLAVWIKMQGILIFPVLFLIHFSWKRKDILIYQGLGFFISTVLINILPFIVNIERFGSSVGQVVLRNNTVANSGATFWANLTLSNRASDPFVYLEKGSISLSLLAYLAYFSIFIYLFIKSKDFFSAKKLKIDFHYAIILSTILTATYFLFLTKMHSRYYHFALIFMIIMYVTIAKDNLMYKFKRILLSSLVVCHIAYFINQLATYVYFNDNLPWAENLESGLNFNKNNFSTSLYMISFALLMCWFYINSIFDKYQNSD